MLKAFRFMIVGLVLAGSLLPGCGKSEVTMKVDEEEARQRMEEINRMMENLPPDARQSMEQTMQQTREMMPVVPADGEPIE
jgi:hypothetical protein